MYNILRLILHLIEVMFTNRPSWELRKSSCVAASTLCPSVAQVFVLLIY